MRWQSNLHTVKLDERKRGLYLRKFALLLSVCAFLALSALAHAQQVDIAVGAGILISTKNTSASQSYLAPPEKGGIYPSVSLTRIRKSRLGYNAEVAFRYKEGIYNNFQQFQSLPLRR